VTRRLYAALALIAGFAGLGASSNAMALDYCITCAGPEAHYNCRLEAPGANPRDLRLQLLCISQVATGGGHESCAVDHPQPAACTGTLQVVTAPDIMVAPTGHPEPKADVAGSGGAEDITPPQAPAAKSAETVIPKPAKPPKTVKEVVENGSTSASKGLKTAGGAVNDAANAAGSGLQKAGTAVTNAAKKTWTCITSLFGDC
jgi:hypothetical protein